MGYNTIKRKFFIKVDETRVIPFVCTIASNCYEASGRRAREDFALYTNGIVIDMNDVEQYLSNTVDQIQKNNIKEYNEDPNLFLRWNSKDALEKEYIEDNLGYLMTFYVNSNTRMSKKQILRWFKNGFSDAKTIEEWKELGLHSFNFNSLRDGISVNTSEELLKTIETKDVCSFTALGVDRTMSKMKRLRKERKMNTVRETETYDRSYVIGIEDNDSMRYLVRLTKYGYKYQYDKDAYINKRFPTAAKAQYWINRQKRNTNFVIVESENPITITK